MLGDLPLIHMAQRQFAACWRPMKLGLMRFLSLLCLVTALADPNDRVETTLGKLSQENLVPCSDATTPDVLSLLAKLHMHKGDVQMSLKCAELAVITTP
jgi:hypothetical protein